MWLELKMCNFQIYFWWLISGTFPVKPSSVLNTTVPYVQVSIVFKVWLGAIRQPSIIWTNIHHVLWHHMASELIPSVNSQWVNWVISRFHLSIYWCHRSGNGFNFTCQPVALSTDLWSNTKKSSVGCITDPLCNETAWLTCGFPRQHFLMQFLYHNLTQWTSCSRNIDILKLFATSKLHVSYDGIPSYEALSLLVANNLRMQRVRT